MAESKTGKSSGPVGAKQAYIDTLPPPCFTVALRGLCCYAEFGFLPNVMLHIIAKHLHFGLISWKNSVGEVWWFVWRQQMSLSPATLPNKCHTCSNLIFFIIS